MSHVPATENPDHPAFSPGGSRVVAERPSTHPDHLPPLPLPVAVPSERIVSALTRRTEHATAAEAGYRLYYQGRIEKKEHDSARERLKNYVSPEERAELEEVMRRCAGHEAQMRHGLAEQAAQQRLLEELAVREYAALSAYAEGKVTRVREAAEALSEGLRRYLAAWNDADEQWESLAPGVRAAIEARDQRFGGHVRDVNRVRREAQVVPSPLPADVLDLIRTVMPRPAVYSAK
jgi:hypothetical protein